MPSDELTEAVVWDGWTLLGQLREVLTGLVLHNPEGRAGT